nr:Ig-like domain repeat protein [Geodermatophilaceae bacterium]
VTSAAQTQSETPTGKIQFVVNGKPYGSPMTLKADGTLLSPQSSRLGVGTHVIRAEYSGDAIFGPSNSSFTHEVTAAP